MVKYYCLTYISSTRVDLVGTVISCTGISEVIKIRAAKIYQINDGDVCPSSLPPDRSVCQRVDVTTRLSNYCEGDKCTNPVLSLDAAGSANVCPEWFERRPVYLEVKYGCEKGKHIHVIAYKVKLFKYPTRLDTVKSLIEDASL